MNNTDLSAFHELYMKTASAYIHDLKALLASDWQTRSTRETEEKLYIIAHSLSSQSTAMNYTKIAALCNTFEKIFYQIKEKGRVLTDQLIQELQGATTTLEDALSGLEKTGEEPDLTETVEKLNKNVLSDM